MDEVLADYTRKVIRVLTEESGYEVDLEKIKGKFLSQSLPIEHLERVTDFPYRPGFFRDLEPIEHSREVLAELNRYYEVFIVTAATRYVHSLKDKMEWLEEHFPFISHEQVVLCGNKSIISTDYLIDDHPKHLAVFSGKPILFTAFHNIYEERFDRVNNWLEVRELFL